MKLSVYLSTNRNIFVSSYQQRRVILEVRYSFDLLGYHKWNTEKMSKVFSIKKNSETKSMDRGEYVVAARAQTANTHSSCVHMSRVINSRRELAKICLLEFCTCIPLCPHRPPYTLRKHQTWSQSALSYSKTKGISLKFLNFKGTKNTPQY